MNPTGFRDDLQGYLFFTGNKLKLQGTGGNDFIEMQFDDRGEAVYGCAIAGIGKSYGRRIGIYLQASGELIFESFAAISFKVGCP